LVFISCKHNTPGHKNSFSRKKGNTRNRITANQVGSLASTNYVRKQVTINNVEEERKPNVGGQERQKESENKK
jgi:hypothetical protein